MHTRSMTLHDHLASADKTLEFIAGDHYLQVPDDARDVVANMVASWLDARCA